MRAAMAADIPQTATRLLAACSTRAETPSPTSADPAFNLDDAYAVEGEIARIRRAEGRATTGLKVGYANKAVWRALKLETLVWAHMYDDTVVRVPDGVATLSLNRMYAPKIEPEVVFKMKQPPEGSADAATVLGSVEWLALGFEIIDCVFPGWQFQPADFVAAKGLHAALLVGTPLQVTEALIPALAEQLPSFKVRLLKDGQLVEEGSGKNSLRSPALCLGELAGAVRRRSSSDALKAGDLVSSGTLTTPTRIAAGEEWRAEIEGIDLDGLTLRVEG